MEQIKRLPLKALKFFFFTAKHGSLTAAAEALHVTHGAVSKQLKLLEAHLGTALWLKEGRRLRLSPAGRQLQAACGEAFAGLDEVLNRLQGGKSRDLVVSCEPTLAMKWLIPRITAFPQDAGFNVVILAAGGAVDFGRQSVDVAIRRNDFAWPAGIATERLGDEKMGAVQIPALAHFRRLHSHSRPEAWNAWLQHGGAGAEMAEDMYFEHFYLSIQAAVAGLGVAMASQWMVADEIENGVLAAPEGFKPDGSAYYLLSAEPFEADERKQRFLACIQAQMGG